MKIRKLNKKILESRKQKKIKKHLKKKGYTRIHILPGDSIEYLFDIQFGIGDYSYVIVIGVSKKITCILQAEGEKEFRFIEEDEILKNIKRKKTIRTFENKKELAEALLKGEKWKILGSDEGYCFFDEISILNETYIPFRFGTKAKNTKLDGWWNCANGINKWEKVTDLNSNNNNNKNGEIK